MRRPQSEPAISPKVIKHFAVITVVLTILLAVFAKGEETELSAKIRARQAKNDMISAEAQKLGTRKLTDVLGVKKPVVQSGGDDSPGGDTGSGGGSGSGRTVAADASYHNRSGSLAGMPPAELGMKPGAQVTVNGQEAGDTPGANQKPDQKKPAKKAFKPNAKQKADIQEVSRARTGSAGVN